MVVLKTYWNIGRRIVDEEQNGNERAEYGSALLKELSNELTKEYGRDFRTLIIIQCDYYF